MTVPSVPIRAGYNREGVAIHDPKEVERDIYVRTGGTKVKYVNKTRQSVLEEVRSRASAMTIVAQVSFFSTGIIGGVLLAAVAVAVIGTAATPVGWAMAGIAVVGMSIMIGRHFYMKEHGLKTDTGIETAKGAGWAVGGFCIAGLIAGLVGYLYIKSQSTEDKEKQQGERTNREPRHEHRTSRKAAHHREYTNAMAIHYLLSPPRHRHHHHHHCCYHVEYSLPPPKETEDQEDLEKIFEKTDSKGASFVYRGDMIVPQTEQAPEPEG